MNCTENKNYDFIRTLNVLERIIDNQDNVKKNYTNFGKRNVLHRNMKGE